MEERNEKIEFQYIMDYRAYRRKMVAIRVACTAVVVGGMLGLIPVSIALSVILSVIVLCIGSIAVLVSFGNEQGYTVYDTRIVIKKRNSDNRISIDMDRIEKVTYRRALYEKDLATGTIKIKAKNDKGRLRSYKLYHIFDAQPLIDYLNERISQKQRQSA